MLPHVSLLMSASADAGSWTRTLGLLTIAAALVLANGFFVAAEFALVKIRPSRIDARVREGVRFAATARWLISRLEQSLSACQLGITMASLALGWVGEPAFATLVVPVLNVVHVTGENTQHVIAFIVAFTAITALHLIIGEQAPKIFSIREPEKMLLWCADEDLLSGVLPADGSAERHDGLAAESDGTARIRHPRRNLHGN